MRRLRERKQGGSHIIHVDGAGSNDYTLCGLAYEGENGDNEVKEVLRGKIDCPDCLAVVAHCKSIPARFLAK